jgi:hypothetical protein
MIRSKRWLSTAVVLGVFATSVDSIAVAGLSSLPSRFRLKDDSCHLIGVALGVANSQRAMPGGLNVSNCAATTDAVTCQTTSQKGGDDRAIELVIDTNEPPFVFLGPKGGINFVYIDLELGRYSWSQVYIDVEKKASFTKQCTGEISRMK